MERYLLMESESGSTSLDVLKYKYPQSIISHRVLEKLYEEDPSPDKTLFNWMVQQNIKSSHKEDVNNHVIQLANEFFTLKDKLKIKDINFYHNMDILQHEINHVKAHLTKAEKKKFKIEEGEIIYEDIRYQILNPLTLSEICNAGYDTDWCASNHNLPGKLEEYNAYVIIHKKIKHPDIQAHDDFANFTKQQEQYFSLRKILVLIHKGFKGGIHEADLDDYLLIDANNEVHDCSIADLTNPSIERVVFAHFKAHSDETVELSIVEQLQNPELKEEDVVELIYMLDYTNRKPDKGERGVCTGVVQTPYGVQYQMKWVGGSTLALQPEDDIYRKIGGSLNEGASLEQIAAHIRKRYVGSKVYLKDWGTEYAIVKVLPDDVKSYLEVMKAIIVKHDIVLGVVNHHVIRQVFYNFFKPLKNEIQTFYGVEVLYDDMTEYGDVAINEGASPEKIVDHLKRKYVGTKVREEVFGKTRCETTISNIQISGENEIRIYLSAKKRKEKTKYDLNVPTEQSLYTTFEAYGFKSVEFWWDD
jgi:hypothetical protein